MRRRQRQRLEAQCAARFGAIWHDGHESCVPHTKPEKCKEAFNGDGFRCSFIGHHDGAYECLHITQDQEAAVAQEASSAIMQNHAGPPL